MILWSDDVQEFGTVDLGTEDWLEGVATSGSVAVAVGDNAAIYRSEDGLQWTRQTVGFTNWLRGVAWGGDVFVAVGDDGLIVTSSDGMEWTPREVSDGRPVALNRVAWTGDGFVVAGDRFEDRGVVIFGNARGTSWVRQTQSGATGDLLAAAAESIGSRLVAGDFEVRLASGSSVISWSDQAGPPAGAPLATYLAAISDGREYTLGGRSGLTVTGVHSSGDPVQTDWIPYPSPPRNWLFDVVTNSAVSTNVTVRLENDTPRYDSQVATNAFYTAVGDLGTVLTSESGVTWSAVSSPTNAADRVYLAVAGGTPGMVAVGGGGLISYSPASHMEVVTTNQYLLSDGTLLEATVTNAVSTLGLLWQEVASPTNLDFLSICSGPDLLVLGGASGYLATSTDGIQWTGQISGTTRAISGLEYANGRYVAVGEEGLILTSDDAVTWTPRESGSTNWLFRIRAGNGQWIAVGRDGAILTSADTISWTPRASGITNSLNDVEFAFGRWFVAGNQGTLLHSTDGVDWTADTQLITGKSLYALASRDAQLVTVGIEGVVLRTRLAPYLKPVEMLKYPQGPDERLFIFRGELDQRFRLDRGPAVNELHRGPVLQITDPDGLLYYFDPVHEVPAAQIFVAPNVP
ncbi:MAG: hypothetical protein J0L84_09210 [Verrucomicrobia bacterium]|nr:hypothetical protein [Verrucomicrobiota bacterium]